MDSSSKPIEIMRIPRKRIAPNPWNPNRMPPDKREKLRREIAARGFLSPILVRPLGDGYQVVDGEHRFRIADELGLDPIPCVVAELDDREARIKTLQLNGLRGDNDPDRLAELLADLRSRVDPDALAALLPWSRQEFDEIMETVTRDARAAVARVAVTVKPLQYEVFSVVVTAEERRTIRDAVARRRREQDLATDGEALALICLESMYEGVSHGSPS